MFAPRWDRAGMPQQAIEQREDIPQWRDPIAPGLTLFSVTMGLILNFVSRLASAVIDSAASVSLT
jgi:hypothetical protein